MNYNDSRLYVNGDDTRSINWKQSARKDQLIINRYHDENLSRINIILDARSSMFYGTSHQPKIRTAIKTLIATTIGKLNSDSEVIIYTLDEKINRSPEIKTREDLANYLSNLCKKAADQLPENASSMEQALTALYPELITASSLIIISDFYDISRAAGAILNTINSKGIDTVIYRVMDCSEQNLPQLYPVSYITDNSRNALRIKNKKEYKSLKKAAQNKISLIDDQLQHLHANSTTFINTDSDNKIISWCLQ